MRCMSNRNKNRSNVLWIIVPCYNEEAVLTRIYRDFIDILHIMKINGMVDIRSVLVFVDDGSTDNTWNVIKSITNKSYDVHGLKLKENSGQQCAIMAGLMMAKRFNADVTISIDCDGQDDLSAMVDMVEKYNAGYDIVYGVRNNRDSDTFFKRFTALMYYKLIKFFDKTMIYNHSEFRLMSRKVLCYLDSHGEKQLFIRKLCSHIDYYAHVKSTSVYYARSEREAGETKYSASSLIRLALISIRPVKTKIDSVPHDNQYKVETFTYAPDIAW